MKTCPVCGASYTAHISFCFEDGAVLEIEAQGTTSSSSSRSGRVPSRVATPVSPVRRGRSLLSNRNRRGLSFTPPTPAPSAPEPADELAPTPLEPLDIPDEADLEFPWEPPPEPVPGATPPEVPGGQQAERASDETAPTPTPTPVDEAGRVEPGTPDDAEETFDDLDFPEMGVGDVPYADEPVEVEPRRRRIPVWLIPVALAALVLGIVGVVVIGGAVGLIGSSGLQRDASPPGAATQPTPAQPEATPAPPAQPAPDAGEPATADAAPDTEPAEPDASEPSTADAEPDATEPVPPDAEPDASEPSTADPEAAEPEPAAPAPAVADAAPAPEPAPIEPTSPEPEASPWGSVDVQSSTVSVGSVPGGAEVWLDGERIGTTPLRADIEYGEHLLEARLDGYDPTFRDITVDEATEQFTLQLKGQAKSGAVIVVLEGWDGATLYVDGEKMGVLPARITLTEGTHEFKVESPSGTQSVTRDVVLADGVTIVNLSG